jgi:hypothetical protein
MATANILLAPLEATAPIGGAARCGATADTPGGARFRCYNVAHEGDRRP